MLTAILNGMLQLKSEIVLPEPRLPEDYVSPDRVYCRALQKARKSARISSITAWALTPTVIGAILHIDRLEKNGLSKALENFDGSRLQQEEFYTDKMFKDNQVPYSAFEEVLRCSMPEGRSTSFVRLRHSYHRKSIAEILDDAAGKEAPEEGKWEEGLKWGEMPGEPAKETAHPSAIYTSGRVAGISIRNPYYFLLEKDGRQLPCRVFFAIPQFFRMVALYGSCAAGSSASPTPRWHFSYGDMNAYEAFLDAARHREIKVAGMVHQGHLIADVIAFGREHAYACVMRG